MENNACNPTEATQQTNNCCNCEKKKGGFFKNVVKVLKYVGIGIAGITTGVVVEKKYGVYDRAMGCVKKAHEQKGGEQR